jgi:hypothetical protein
MTISPSTSFTTLILAFYSVAFISFETILFLLTLAKFLAALRNGWGRTPVIYLLMRDGTWAFILIFGEPASSFIAIPFLAYMPNQSHSASTPASFSARVTQLWQP